MVHFKENIIRYLLITFFRQPSGQINEQAGFSKKIKPNDISTCNVIIDYKERKVLKCVIEGKVVPTDFERMHEYYREVYPDLIAQLEKMNIPNE